MHGQHQARCGVAAEPVRGVRLYRQDAAYRHHQGVCAGDALKLRVRQQAAEVAQVDELQPLGAEYPHQVLPAQAALQHVVVRREGLNLEGGGLAGRAQPHRSGGAVAVVVVAAQHLVGLDVQRGESGVSTGAVGVENQRVCAADYFKTGVSMPYYLHTSASQSCMPIF